MKKKHFVLGIFAIFLALFLAGCSFLQSPGIEKELFSWQIPKTKMTELKNVILADGYKEITKEDYSYEGALVTQYKKRIITTPDTNKKSYVVIMLNFKATNPEFDFYKNLGITIYNAEYKDQKIEHEVQSIEAVLYKSLIDLAGPSNVVRGKR
jgi:hypothetical protein